MLSSSPIIDVPFSLQIMLLLVGLLLAALVMFGLILRRETTGRQWLARLEWARMNRMKLRRNPTSLPPPLDRLSGISGVAEAIIEGDKVQLVRFVSIFNDDLLYWHAMIHQIESDWPATALRPSDAARSLTDHFYLDLHTSLASERFQLKGESVLAAQALADSSERALLPRDLGLLLIGRRLVIDFSNRPFDPIEFTRLMELAEQLIAHLPQRQKAAMKE